MILSIGSQYVNKHSQGFACQKHILFLTQLTWQWSMNIIKIMSRRFQNLFGMFTMLLVEGSSQTGLLRHLSDNFFAVRNFGNTKSIRVIFFLKLFKISYRFRKWSNNSEKVFCFRENCISIGIVKLSLLRTGYFSLVGNLLTSRPKIWHVNKRKVFQLNWLGSDQWIS